MAKPRRVLPWVLGCLGLAGLLVVGAILLFSVDRGRRARGGPGLSPTPAITATPAPPGAETPENALQIPAPTPPPANQSAGTERIQVEITSEPGSCHVTIDGRHAGFTPLTQSLDPGKHQFACEWPGQGKRSFEETISPERRRLRFRL